MKTAIVKMFKYIERFNARNFAKIYFYEVLKLETSKN